MWATLINRAIHLNALEGEPKLNKTNASQTLRLSQKIYPLRVNEGGWHEASFHGSYYHIYTHFDPTRSQMAPSRLLLLRTYSIYGKYPRFLSRHWIGQPLQMKKCIYKKNFTLWQHIIWQSVSSGQHLGGKAQSAVWVSFCNEGMFKQACGDIMSNGAVVCLVQHTSTGWIRGGMQQRTSKKCSAKNAKNPKSMRKTHVNPEKNFENLFIFVGKIFYERRLAMQHLACSEQSSTFCYIQKKTCKHE